MYKLKTILISVISGLLIITGIVWAVINLGLVKNKTIPIIKNIPSFKLTTQDGHSFSDLDLVGKVTILDFIFTSCVGPCPLMTHNMRKLYDQYQYKPDVQFVSITVDPRIDTKELLKQYALANGVKDERWKFLTVDIELIKSISKEGFLLFADNLPAGHAINFVLIDRKGQIRKYYDGTDDDSIVMLLGDIDFILKEISS